MGPDCGELSIVEVGDLGELGHDGVEATRYGALLRDSATDKGIMRHKGIRWRTTMAGRVHLDVGGMGKCILASSRGYGWLLTASCTSKIVVI